MTASFLKFIYTGQGNWKIYSEHCQQQQRGHGLVSGRAEPQLLLPSDGQVDLLSAMLTRRMVAR